MDRRRNEEMARQSMYSYQTISLVNLDSSLILCAEKPHGWQLGNKGGASSTSQGQLACTEDIGRRLALVLMMNMT